MRLAVPRRQVNKVLINKRKYQFSWTKVAWQVTRDRQIYNDLGCGKLSCWEKVACKTCPTIYSLRLVNAESLDWLLKYFTHSNENISMTLFLITARFVKLPKTTVKTRQRSRAAAKTVRHRWTSAMLQTFFFGFFQPNFRTASVNSFQPTAFHSYPICVHVLHFS